MTTEDPFELLDAALDEVPGPPLEQISEAAIWEWLERVWAGLVLRRDGRRLASAVEAALRENYLTAEHVRRTQAQMERHEAIKTAREAGTYWAELEVRRKARRATHVEVDPDAWTLLRPARPPPGCDYRRARRSPRHARSRPSRAGRGPPSGRPSARAAG